MKNYFLLLVLFILPFISIAQVKYSGRVEYSSLRYIGPLVRYETDRGDPYYMDERVNGKEINLVNGINLKDRVFMGIGISYLDFAKIKGFSTTLDLEYRVLKTKLSPLLNFRFGTNYLKNQYDVHKSAVMGGPDIGFSYKPFKMLSFYAKTGFVITHNVGFFTTRGGIQF